MTEKFENKQLNKKDHEKIDKEADIARNFVGVAGLILIGKVVKIVPKIKNSVVDVMKKIKA